MEQDEIQDRLKKLELENLRLKAELEARKATQSASKTAGQLASRATTRFLVGKGLKNSVKQLLDELPGKPSKDTVSDVVTHVIWRLTRIGTFALIATMTPMLVMIIQTWMLSRQNDKLETQNLLIGRQNERLDQQINLEEGNRRSSLIFFMSNIMDRIDDELQDNNNPGRHLSESLIGRIVSLTQSLRPYRYLENDELTPRPLSPERAQLLFSLINSNLDKKTYDIIFARANFSYADLREANFSNAYLRGAKLANAYFSKANFYNANLDNADLSDALLEEATFRQTSMKGINLARANLRKGKMEAIQMIKGNLNDADLREIQLEGNFTGTNLEGVKVQNARLKNVNLEGCWFLSKNWVDSLKNSNLKGIEFVVDIYEVRKEERRQGFVTDSVFVLRTDPASKLAIIRDCNDIVASIVESSPAVKQKKQATLSAGQVVSLYAERNPFGMQAIGIKKDSTWLYRLSVDETDVASTVMWVQFNPKQLTLWELYPDGKKSEPLDFDKNLLKNLKLECSAQ